MTTEADRRFNWRHNVFIALLAGILASVVVLALSVPIVKLGNEKLEAGFSYVFLAIGGAVARWVYGGLHGEEPILLMMLVNSIVYALVVLLVLWLRFKRAQTASASG